MAEYQSKDQLYTVLDQVVAGLQQDDTFKKRIANANASLAFVLSDLDNAEYKLSFSQGNLSGTPGGASDATVSVITKSDTLDKLLSGKLSGESAYFSGALRLRGDEWMAQSMAYYLSYMGPLYRQATEQS